MDTKYSRYFNYIRPFLKNTESKTYGSIIFSIVTITIFSVFAIKPTLETIVSLQKSIAEQKLLLERLDKKTNDLTLGKQNYEKIDTETKQKLDSLIPEQPRLPGFIQVLSSITNSQQASLSGLQFQPIDLPLKSNQSLKELKTKEIEFNFSSVASYSQLNTILNILQESERLVEIKTITLNKSTDGPLIMTINGQVYYLGE